MNENLLSILRPIFKWRRYIILTTLLIGIGSAIISLTLDNYYKSTTVFYSASPDLAKPAPMGPMDTKQDFYGEDEDLDRLFSISTSSEVFKYLSEKYNLYEHYDINPDHAKGPHRLRKKFDKLVKAQKTKFNALQLSVEDKDPSFAANMANDARDKIGEIAQRVIKESQLNLLNSLKKNIDNKEDKLDTSNDSLTVLRDEYGVINTNSQGEVLAGLLSKKLAALKDVRARYKSYKDQNIMFDSLSVLRAKISGLEQQTSSIKSEKDKFGKGLDKILTMEFVNRQSSEQLGLDKERQKLLEAAYESPFSSLHLVEAAEVPVMKSRPRRFILVLASALLGFFLCCVGAIVIHTYRSINWNELASDI